MNDNYERKETETQKLEHFVAELLKRIDQLEEGNKKLQERLKQAEIGNIYIREIANNKAEIDGDIVKLVMKTLIQLFETSKAVNFVLQELKDKDGNEYEVIVQKKNMLNPTQKWKQAQAKLDEISEWARWSSAETDNIHYARAQSDVQKMLKKE